MIFFILALAFGVTVSLLSDRFIRKFDKSSDTDPVFRIFFQIVWVIVFGGILAFIGIPGMKLTGGLGEDYSVGERVGYIVKVSKRGIVWKTYEIQMQMGTGELAALQLPHEMSCDEETAKAVSVNFGRNARVKYNQWLVMPYWRGESNYWVTSIEWEDDDNR